MFKIIRRNKKRKQRSSLKFLAFFLFGSAALRITTHVPEAYAKTETPSLEPAVNAPTECAPPPDVAQVLKALSDRETRLSKNEQALRDRMQALAVSDEIVTKKLEDLVAAEDRLRESIALAEVAAEDDLTKLTAVYENMKPQEAALLFEEMAPDFAAGFLGRMRPDAAAGVMAGLEPTTAYTISVILAGRNANAPTE